MTPHETAVKIAEACMDAIEKRRGIIKDDLIEAARGVLAGSLSGSMAGSPYTIRYEGNPVSPPTVYMDEGNRVLTMKWSAGQMVTPEPSDALDRSAKTKVDVFKKKYEGMVYLDDDAMMKIGRKEK